MGLILNDLKNACELEHVCDYVNNRTTSSMNYISTENMLPHYCPKKLPHRFS